MSSRESSRDGSSSPPSGATLERSELRALQAKKLGRLMAELARNPFYRRKLEAAGVEPAAVRSLEDLAAVPFTTKAELVEAQERHPPYGDLLTYPLSRYRYLHQTSGTSGQPLLWLDTEDDWQTWLRCWGQVFRGAGVGPGDVVFCAFSFGPYVAHWSSLAGARAIGALALPGSGMSSIQRLERITTLARSGMPVVRYRTGDLAVRNDQPCACGRRLSRLMGGVLGRADDMLIVRGVNVYPSAVDDLMRGLPQIIEYEVEIRRRQALDELLIRVETAPDQPFEPVERALHEAFRSRLNIRVGVARAAAGSLPRYELKAQRYKRIDE